MGPRDDTGVQMGGPLDGLRVVDCSSGTTGPRVTGFLADYGADVIWVERPGGDACRGNLAVEYSVFNRGKRSIELDLASDAGRTALHGLLGEADVLVTGWRPGVAAQLGLDPADVRARHASLVVCSLTGFGVGGPHRDVPGHEALVHALVGTMAEQIGMRDGPIFEGLPFASIGAAYLALIGILAALHRRTADGIGRMVETSLLDGALAYHATFWGETDADGEVRTGITENDFLVGGNARLICGSFLCADDRYVSVHTGAVGAFGRLMKVLGLDDRVRCSENGLDMGIPLSDEEKAVLHGEIHGIFARDDVDTWVARLLDADVCGIPVLQPGEVFDEPQTTFNEMVVQVDDPVLGRVEQVAPPVKLSHVPPAVRAAAPTTGSTAVADVIEGWRQGGRSWCGSGEPDRGPLLHDVRILDLGAFFAGPYSSRLLAELGADVIKLEPTAGDPFRGLPAMFRAAQAGKRSIAADLKDPSLGKALEHLIAWADVIHHNMRPGAAERVGIAEGDARRINPDVIYGYAPGWGSAGPYALRQSFEPMMSGYVGVGFEVAGEYNPPLYPQGNADPGNGLLGAVAMLMALLHRDRTGEALRFENPQLNATMTHVAHIVRRADDRTVLNAGKLDPLQFGTGPLERLYETADGWLCVVALSHRDQMALARVTGTEFLDDPRFGAPGPLAENATALGELLEDVFRAGTTEAWYDALSAAGVPCAAPVPYNNFTFMRDPENRASGRVAECVDPKLGRVRELALLVRVSDVAPVPHRLAPALGAHTGEILAEAGFTAAAIDDLRSRGSIWMSA